MRPLQAIKITKLGSVESPYDPYSDFGDRAPFHLGVWLGPPVIGQRFKAAPYSSKPNERGISSSPVTKIIDENTFETLNSIYKIENMIYNIKISDWVKIILVACDDWKKKLIDYAFSRTHENELHVSENFLELMLKSSTQSQKDLILSLFPDYQKKEDPYKKFRDAEKEGKTIQINQGTNDIPYWMDLAHPFFNADVDKYRIKHKHQDMIDEWEASGRTLSVQYFSIALNEWTDVYGSPTWGEINEYRFKPEEKYVPYTFEDAKELIGKVVKHKKISAFYLIGRVTINGVLTTDSTYFTYERMLEELTDIDGNPLGKLKTK